MAPCGHKQVGGHTSHTHITQDPVVYVEVCPGTKPPLGTIVTLGYEMLHGQLLEVSAVHLQSIDPQHFLKS